MIDTRSTVLPTVELKLPLLKAKRLAPVLKHLAKSLEELSGQSGIAEEIEEVARRLDHINHGEHIKVPVCLHLFCENGGD